MQLEHSFSVPVGIDEAWRILIDIERIGPCLPGAAIDSVEGDEFTGTVKVKLGPINLTYKGKAAFVEKDEAARRAVIDARGRDARGNGTAAAKVTATLHENGDRTEVKVLTDLDVTGKPAQFGRGVMVDVGNKLLGQFADSLARTIQGPPAADAPAETKVATAQQADTPAEAEAATAQPAPSAAAADQAPAAAPGAETEPVQAAAPQPAPESSTASPAVPEPAAETGELPVYSTPGGMSLDDLAEIGTPDGRSAAAARPADDVEPIDLLHSAGPAVARRLAPIAVALVVVLMAVRRYRRHD